MRVLPYAQFVCTLAPLLSSTAHVEPGDLDTLAHMLLDRFQLENGCEPINLFVAASTGGPAGLTPESVTVTVRSRL